MVQLGGTGWNVVIGSHDFKMLIPQEWPSDLGTTFSSFRGRTSRDQLGTLHAALVPDWITALFLQLFAALAAQKIVNKNPEKLPFGDSNF